MVKDVCIILVNWNGWRDTIECLESLFRNDYPHYQVIVCDNGSSDRSVEYLSAWAEGRLGVEVDESNPLKRLVLPRVPKPIRYVECERALAEAGGAAQCRDARLVIVRNRANVGLGEGNNVGMRYALARKVFDYCWLLNNDTVIEPTALSQMVARMEDGGTVGMCGSTILYYSHPTRIQSLGGATYNRWTGVPRSVGEWQTFDPAIASQSIDRKLDYINGASLLVSTPFVRDIGLMSTRYFLYYEELDWSARADGRYRIVYAPESIVYHKHGASIGSSRNPSEISEISDYYALLSRLSFTKTYYPYALPTVYLGFVVTVFNRIRRGQWRRIGLVARVLWRHLLSFFVQSPLAEEPQERAHSA